MSPVRPLVTRYQDDLSLFPTRWHKIALVLGVIVLIAIPLTTNRYWLDIVNLTAVYVVGAVALVILTGFTGQISLGHAGFLAVGAYTAAVFGNHLGVPFWLVIPLAGFIAAAVGLAAGPFALRLRGLYLAIITIGLVFVVNHTLRSFPQLTGGVQGTSVPMLWWFDRASASNFLGGYRATTELGPVSVETDVKLYILFVAIAAFTIWCGTNIRRSNSGRAMMAVRDHDLAAAVLGVSPAKYKIIAFGISSFFAGVAGAMYGFKATFITIDPPFNLLMSVEFIAIIVIGGATTVFGATIGALFFGIVRPLAESVANRLDVLQGLSASQQSGLMLAMLVIGFMLIEPTGLRGVWVRVKRYFTSWPFKY
jgi:branched-chain amino acid transport system permease protein